MKEILDILKQKMLEEAKKDHLNTGMITELVEAYRRLSAFGAETISEMGLSSDEISSPLRIRQVPAVREDSILDQAMAGFKSFKNLAAPQEMDAILKARELFEKEKDVEMVQLIDNRVKQKVKSLLSEENG